MNLGARVRRLERGDSRDPFEHLTDEELQTAIDTVREQIEAAVGMPEAEYAAVLAEQMRAGELPAYIDRLTAEAFVRDVSKGRTAHV